MHSFAGPSRGIFPTAIKRYGSSHRHQQDRPCPPANCGRPIVCKERTSPEPPIAAVGNREYLRRDGPNQTCAVQGEKCALCTVYANRLAMELRVHRSGITSNWQLQQIFTNHDGTRICRPYCLSPFLRCNVVGDEMIEHERLDACGCRDAAHILGERVARLGACE